MQHITVRIIHGSIRHRQHRDEPKELGGIRGGHVGIQIDEFVFDFQYRDKSRIHIFSNQKAKNCIFQKHPTEVWAEIFKGKQETCISIPVNETEKALLLDFYYQNLLEPSYDYSFFGQRCASSCYALLKKINKMQGGHYFFNAFYPGMLRRKLVAQARQFGYDIRVVPGLKRGFGKGVIFEVASPTQEEVASQK